MPAKPCLMSIIDAANAMAVLTAWAPPEGVKSTVTFSRHPQASGDVAVRVVLSATEDDVFVVAVEEVPDEEALDSLTQMALHILQTAWDQSACLSIGPLPTDVPAPGGPLALRSSPHPVYDTSDFGRDL